MTPLMQDLRLHIKPPELVGALTYSTSLKMGRFVTWQMEFQLGGVSPAHTMALQHCEGLNLLYHEVNDDDTRD